KVRFRGSHRPVDHEMAQQRGISAPRGPLRGEGLPEGSRGQPLSGRRESCREETRRLRLWRRRESRGLRVCPASVPRSAKKRGKGSTLAPARYEKACYLRTRRRASAKPLNPKPSSASVAGSGTCVRLDSANSRSEERR